MQVKILTFSALYDQSCVYSNLFSLLSYITDYTMRDFRTKIIFVFKTTAGSKHHLQFVNIYSSGAPNDGFALITLKTLFRLSRVLLDL